MRATHRNLAIEYTELKSLRLNPQNPRLHSDKQVDQLASSIRSFGFKHEGWSRVRALEPCIVCSTTTRWRKEWLYTKAGTVDMKLRC
jgi:hypothetical protein